LLELLPPAVLRLPAHQLVLREAEQLHDDATVREPQGCSHRKPQSPRAQQQVRACPRRDGDVCHRHLQQARVREAAPR
jgi:hypothetical protein